MTGRTQNRTGSALAIPVSELRGVGMEREAQLARLGLHTVEDLLLHRPRRYEDRRHVGMVAGLKVSDTTTVRGRIVALGLKRYAGGAKSLFEFILEDGTARLHCRWWNLPFMQQYFRQGDEVLVYGKVCSVRPRTMDHPETEVVEGGEENSIHLNRIAPIYPLTEGLTQRWLRGLIFRALEQYGSSVTDPWPTFVPSGWPSRSEAIKKLHFPAELSDAEQARQRLALDELIRLQLGIQGRRRTLQAKAQAWPCAGNNTLIKPFLARLGFALTEAQKRVLREIRNDMGGGHPMRRLLQGDVGSGKTVVAACAALMALQSEFNAALMAPTEILAEQHFQNFSRWFEPLDITVALRTGSRRAPRKQNQTSISDSTLVIGTHALLEDSVLLDKLGLVIIDEQHRFGVAQREKLVRKGPFPHLLVMTATPIPRTLGLTVYGDLDLSVIDELPAGRKPIRTFVRTREKLPKVWAFLRTKLAEGRQAYVVFPRIEEGGHGEVKAVTKEFETLQSELKPFQAGLLHGRLKPVEKEKVMAAFRTNAIQALLTTSLIEVGVDVPNATVMLVENAEQFGLAQLHQLRGRIGRGGQESFCILIVARQTLEAEQRLKVLAETTDGFKIAEADLKLRGPGDLLGQQQSGLPPLTFANLAADSALVEQSRIIAAKILENPSP